MRYGCDMILVYKATLRTEAPFDEVTLIRLEHLQKLLKLTSYSILYIMVCSIEVILLALLAHKFVYTFNFLSVTVPFLVLQSNRV